MVKKNGKDMTWQWKIFKKARDEWNTRKTKKIDFINKRLCDKQHAKQTITDLEDGMREYYQVFGRKSMTSSSRTCLK